MKPGNERHLDPSERVGIPAEEFEKDLEYIKNHPLFMKEVPKDMSSNPELMALQNVLYSDTPENLAVHFNKKGNEYVKRIPEGRHFYNEALKSYTEGIDANSSDKVQNAKLYSNRAQLHLRVRNYRKAIEDCQQAIKLDPTFIKPYFRAASAYQGLYSYKECLEMCEAGLKVDPKCEEILELQQKLIAELEKKKKAKLARREEFDDLVTICKAEGITLARSQYEVPSVDMKLYADENLKLFVPIIVTYPEFKQMDTIKAASEDDPLEVQLAEVIENGLPWDEKEYYNFQTIDAFIELGNKKMKRIDMRKTINEIIKTKDYVLPMILEVLIVSQISPFYQHFIDNSQFC